MQEYLPVDKVVSRRIIYLAIIFERTVVDFLVFLNRQHDFLGGIPTIYQHGPELQLLLVNTIQEHFLHMIEFCLAIPSWIVNSIIDDPKLIQLRIDIHTSHNAYALITLCALPLY